METPPHRSARRIWRRHRLPAHLGTIRPVPPPEFQTGSQHCWPLAPCRSSLLFPSPQNKAPMHVASGLSSFIQTKTFLRVYKYLLLPLLSVHPPRGETGLRLQYFPLNIFLFYLASYKQHFLC